MAKYRDDYSYEQTRVLPVAVKHQIQPGTIEHTINYLIDNEIDLTIFDEQYKNDKTGAPAIDPAILLKIILFAYSRGIISSRQIARACEENMVFMALAAYTRPHFTTIADFISSMRNKIVSVFRDILAVCYTEGLIGKHMFAVDGCKISGNCAKEWSGPKEELRRKAEKIEQGVKVLIRRHRQEDRGKKDPGQDEKEKRAVANLKKKAKKIRDWLEENEERSGAQGNPVKSNITDNESAKMPSSHGVSTSKAPKYFPAAAFQFDASGALICPAGKPMTSSCPNWRDKNKGYTGRTFNGFEKYCGVCELRKKCLRSPASKVRQVTKIDLGIRNKERSAVQVMAEGFDTARGRFFYSRRMGTVEPVFANIRHTLGLDRFTLCGREKVDTQWKLFCLVHNIGKIARYATI